MVSVCGLAVLGWLCNFLNHLCFSATKKKKKKASDLLKWKILEKSHVKPKKKVGKKECQLVTFDLPCLAFYYNQKLLFYKGDNFEGMVKKLKEGLSVALEEFYQLAGKLRKEEEGVFRVEYDERGEKDRGGVAGGVEFVEAEAEADVSLADLTIADSTNNLKELIPYTGILNLEGIHRPL